MLFYKAYYFLGDQDWIFPIIMHTFGLRNNKSEPVYALINVMLIKL